MQKINFNKIDFYLFLIILFLIASLFSIITQYYFSVIQKSFILKKESFIFSNIKFFFYFTIQTNILIIFVYLRSLYEIIKTKKGESYSKCYHRKNFSFYSTAVCVYIIIVAFVYNIFLRKLWNTFGLQRIVDNFLHIINPIFYIFYWVFFIEKNKYLIIIKYYIFIIKIILKWLNYPLLYLFIILISGYFLKSFPYPFLNFYKIGILKVLLNIFYLFLFFIFLSILIIFISSFLQKIYIKFNTIKKDINKISNENK
ncbi:MAG: Pr6Pr family membrane protein [Spirochaetes bacterium]|nr:Pr6Pr family membrane protein [Spirochaetota bacterium]